MLRGPRLFRASLFVGVRQYIRYMVSAVRTVARLESGVHQVMGLQYALACMHVVQDSTDASLAWCCSVSADAQAWGVVFPLTRKRGA